MICVALSILINKHSEQRERSTAYSIDQRLDHLHFNKDFVTTWKQRYFINDNFYESDTDTFIVEIGGEGELHSAPGGTVQNPDIFGKVAEKTHAMLFALEHRYYGPSKPTDDTNENLKKYHNSHEALADLMNFVDLMDQKYCEVERQPGKLCFKWIVLGGSYPGALAGWVAEKYEFAFAASIASSGVVRAVHSLPEFDEETYKASGSACARAEIFAMREIENAMENGNQWPRKYLNIADDEYWNLQDFYWYLADSGLMIEEYGSWSKFCPQITAVYNERGNVTKFFLDYLKSNHYDYMDYSREYMKNDYSVSREWWFQMCAEVGYFEPAPEVNSIRSKSIDIEYHVDVCNYAYNLSLTASDYSLIVDRTNQWYGGERVYGNDTFFTNFWEDVWHDCGITKADIERPNVGYVECKDCGHCEDLHSDLPTDPEPLKDVRAKEVQFMLDKLNDYRK